MPVPLLIENTAGGDNAMARRLEAIARLWDAIGAGRGRRQVGFCLDTCHAWAGGNDLSDVVERILAITGRIDLVHANDSRDTFDSGADRHTNFGSGLIDVGDRSGRGAPGRGRGHRHRAPDRPAAPRWSRSWRASRYFNDATALVALRTAIAATGGGSRRCEVGLDFVRRGRGRCAGGIRRVLARCRVDPAAPAPTR
jgi:hypothetical protein